MKARFPKTVCKALEGLTLATALISSSSITTPHLLPHLQSFYLSGCLLCLGHSRQALLQDLGSSSFLCLDLSQMSQPLILLGLYFLPHPSTNQARHCLATEVRRD